MPIRRGTYKIYGSDKENIAFHKRTAIVLHLLKDEYARPRVNRTSDDPARSHQKNPKKYQKKWYLNDSKAPVGPGRAGPGRISFFSV